ncbi:MAG TPA: CHAD domain-containing protein [Urbifossiella sp.]|nr:CHAD domain-containing protein [Urbifossiella sp.]
MAEGKWIHGLSPGMPVADAARVALAARLEVVRQYLPLAASRPYENVEYVHQLRVGTRRAGAALRVFGTCLPRKHLRAAKQSLRGLRRAAGDARDWDVFLLALAAARGDDPADRPAFDFLAGYALGERSAAQTRLAAAADDVGPRFAADTAVLPGHVRPPRGADAPATFGDLAAEQMTALFAEFARAVSADPAGPDALHQLRILGKRVRYAMELFAPCFTDAFRTELYRAVVALQEALGEVQDAAVGRARLEALRDRVKMVAPGDWPRFEPGVGRLLRGHEAAFAAGRDRFAAWRSEWAAAWAAHPPRLLADAVAAEVR